MSHRHHRCGPGGRFEFDIPEGLFAMRGGRGWQGAWGPFLFDFGDGPEGPSRRGRRSRRMFEAGELQLLLLFLIADKGKPRHGYDLIRSVEELTGGEYAPSPGVVYPTLTLLQDMGFIEESAAEGSRRAYQVTDSGKAHLDENADEVAELFDRLTSLGGDRTSNPGPVLGRAVKNIMTALRHRIGRDGLDEELLHEIAAILDEAAQRIERVKPAGPDLSPDD
jgi:DNA-binding PadR family transcriptional regulator